MSNIPSISIVIPLYNKSRYIARALNSVLAQTYPDFEVIVVDDGSTDNGAEVIKGIHDTRIQLVQQENKGVSAARNVGVSAAETELIAFLDADDEWLPTHLETIMRLRRKYPQAGIYSTHYKQYFLNRNIITPKFYGIPPHPWEGILPNYFKSCTYGETPVCSSTVSIPKNIFHIFGGFQEEYWWGEDTDLWGRIAFEYPVVFSWDGGVILYRNVENRACNKKKAVIHHPFVISATNYMKSGVQFKTDIQYVKEFVEREKISQAMFNIRTGNKKEAQKILTECNMKEFGFQKKICLLLCLFPLPIISSFIWCKNSLFILLNPFTR